MRQPCGSCRVCAVPLHAFSPPEGLCRPCRARVQGRQTAGAYLDPIPYGTYAIECMSCGAPALLCAVQGLEQVLPATLTLSCRCVLCDLVETEEVRLTAEGELTWLGTRYAVPPACANR